MITGHDGDAGLLHEGFGLRLIPHGAYGRCGRANKYNSGIGAGFSKLRVLGQKPITWMNRLRPARPRGLQNLSAIEIAFAGRRRTYPKSFIRKRRVHGAAIRIRIDGGACNPKPPRRSYDAASDLAAIGNEDL